MPLAFILFCTNLAIIGSIIFIAGILKHLIPNQKFHHGLYQPMHQVYRLWALNNFRIINLFNNVDWQITGTENLSKKSWYLLIANHQSWLDIMVLSYICREHTSDPKYFLKESLKRVPFLGMGCWALDMPFMKRYSKEFLEKNPHLKGQDIIATRKSCQAFEKYPTTIINFVEGTRFTSLKQKTHPELKHLLRPKAGGIAYTLATLGSKFDKLLNVTIVYPKASDHIMKDVLKGKMRKIVVIIEQHDIDEKLLGDYFNDSTFKNQFQQRLNKLWCQKDQCIKQLID